MPFYSSTLITGGCLHVKLLDFYWTKTEPNECRSSENKALTHNLEYGWGFKIEHTKINTKDRKHCIQPSGNSHLIYPWQFGAQILWLTSLESKHFLKSQCARRHWVRSTVELCMILDMLDIRQEKKKYLTELLILSYLSTITFQWSAFPMLCQTQDISLWLIWK